MCSACKDVYYCDARCQRAHWRDGHCETCKSAQPPHVPVIHVSGTPGVGKSTLGERLTFIMRNIRVVDTDDIFSEDDHNTLRVIPQDTEEYVRVWKDTTIRCIRRKIGAAINERVSAMVFVGILSNMNGPIGGIVDADSLFPFRVFIDLTIAVLLQQFYTRLGKLHGQQHFWEDVAKDFFPVPSSEQVKRNAATDREWHTQHGYRVYESANAVEKYIHGVVLESAVDAHYYTTHSPLHRDCLVVLAILLNILGTSLQPPIDGTGPLPFTTVQSAIREFARIRNLIRPMTRDGWLEHMRQYIASPNGMGHNMLAYYDAGEKRAVLSPIAVYSNNILIGMQALYHVDGTYYLGGMNVIGNTTVNTNDVNLAVSALLRLSPAFIDRLDDHHAILKTLSHDAQANELDTHHRFLTACGTLFDIYIQ